ncbi:MAG: DUF2235 domain-containing protein [Planctomycetes bacterium]|nr:DUF2235 domain-containing protein [Planctomycetota bacterium]
MSKRIIICCDGTWNTPQERDVTNVVKIVRALKAKDDNDVEQVVFYDWGVGTGNVTDKVKGGTLGKGIDKNIQDAYRFLVHNYARGDKLFFLGFSRGAYTVRSLTGLIRNCWLLKKTKADKIPEAYSIYRSSQGPDHEKAKAFRTENAQKVKVEFMGVWDTVGALGIPFEIFDRLNKKKYAFHDTSISRIVKYAYQGLAIDEKRKPFAPCIWNTGGNSRDSEQAWFVGVHSDVGGGYRECGLSDIALKWIVSKASESGLAFHKQYLASITKDSKTKRHNSFTPKYYLTGKKLRTIGATNTDESLHPSVMRYFKLNKKYRPENLLKFLNQI